MDLSAHLFRFRFISIVARRLKSTLSVVHNCQFCKNGLAGHDAVGEGQTCMGQRNHVLDEILDPPTGTAL